MRSKLTVSALQVLFLLVLMISFTVGCDSVDDDPDVMGTYVGTLAGPTTSGTLQISVDGDDASGSLSLVGGGGRSETTPLTGSYNPDTGEIHLQGGGYHFTGTISNGVLTGTWTGPNGTSGTFTAYLEGEGTVVDVYCGHYNSQNDYGTFNLVRHDANLRGFAVSTPYDNTIDLSGSVSGNNVTIWATDSGPDGNVATGTLTPDGSSFEGTINDPNNPGTVNATRCTPMPATIGRLSMRRAG